MEEPLHNDDLSSLFLFLWKWRKQIILSALATGLLSLIFSYFVIKPKYEAEAILFAAKNNSSERQLAELEFGYDVEADRLIQILLSNSLRDSVIHKFNLAKHYDIDTSLKYGREKLRKEYNRNINFERTQYMSVAVRVRDEDPVLAATIANSIAGIADQVRTLILKKNSRQALDAAKKEFEQKLHIVEVLRDSIDRVNNHNSAEYLSRLSAHYKEKQLKLNDINKSLSHFRTQNNIYDYGEEINILNRQLALAKFNYELESGKLGVFEKSYSDKDTIVVNTRARMEGAHKQMKSIQENLDKLASVNQDYLGLTSRLTTEEKILNDVQPSYENQKYAYEPIVQSALYNSLSSAYNEETSLLNNLQEKYEKAKQMFNEPVSGAYLVSRAEPDLLKKSPSLSLNTLVGFLLGGIMAIVIVLFLEKLKTLNTRPEKNASESILENISRSAMEIEALPKDKSRA